jgi:hypothetical protein
MTWSPVAVGVDSEPHGLSLQTWPGKTAGQFDGDRDSVACERRYVDRGPARAPAGSLAATTHTAVPDGASVTVGSTIPPAPLPRDGRPAGSLSDDAEQDQPLNRRDEGAGVKPSWSRRRR